jgi:hypothetical protein
VKIHILEKRIPGGYTTFGSTWKKGEVKAGTEFTLKNEEQDEIPVQSRITAYWPDGSIKWASHTADSRKIGKQAEILPIEDERIPVYGSKISLESTDDEYRVRGERVSLVIPKSGYEVIKDLYIDGELRAFKAVPVLLLEQREREGNSKITREIHGVGRIDQVTIEEEGTLSLVFCVRGTHVIDTSTLDSNNEEKLPFILRIRVNVDSEQLDFTHTFIYDGDEKRDFLKGIGLRFSCPMIGKNYNRHVKFGTDHGVFHESLNLLLTWRPRIPEAIYQSQIDGKLVDLSDESQEITEAVTKIPTWSNYQIYQDSVSHFVVRKKVKEEECCYLEGLHGYRAPGTAAFGGENGGLLFAMRDFWRKYPSGYTFQNLEEDEMQATVWFWTPEAEPMDFRHYATEGYDQTYYEGFPEVGASPFGIANTNTFSLTGFNKLIPSDQEMKDFGDRIDKPAVYIGSPEYYHELRAFGYWSLPKKDTAFETWLEDQMDIAIEFYIKEIEKRNWYGMYDYGDVMHTYDKFRHSWRYDMGGYAWQNTELVPTLWLWLAFIRTGREDIFTLAEAMSRHCSEVDIYHSGTLKGIGSRHNVRHWGCSCKEARIAMAGHHRYYYYLTGDHRMEDIFDDVKDGDQALLNMDPLRYFYSKEEMTYPTHARSGPDWSSFCSNWMTRWEQFGDKEYEDKIRIGIEDIKKAPLKLVSGPDFEYNPKNSHLGYIGENAAGGTHLQVCMGAAQVWLELGELLEDEEWKQMMADYGRFYYLDRDRQLEESGGRIGDREFSLPFMAAAMGAYGAAYLKDQELAKTTWKILLRALLTENERTGFKYLTVNNSANQEVLSEIPWISTNFVSQWCLNVIMALDFIRDSLPEDMDGVMEMLKDYSLDGFRRA